MDTNAHVDALLTLARTVDGLNVVDAPLDDPTDDDFPYVFLSLPGSRRTTERFVARPHHAVFSFQTTIVALNHTSANVIADKLHDAYTLRRPTVTDRVCGRIDQLVDPSIDTGDTSLPGRTVTTVVDQWQFISDET